MIEEITWKIKVQNILNKQKNKVANIDLEKKLLVILKKLKTTAL